MKVRHHDPINFKNSLEKALLTRHIQPSTMDLPKLTHDLLAAVKNAEHKSARDIVNHLGAIFNYCIPAYRKVNQFGPRIPAVDNILPHTPSVEDAELLTEGRENFHAVDWLRAVGVMSSWATEHTGQPAHAFRIEQCLADLLIEFPAVPVNDRAARALAGRVGLSQLVEVLTEDYPAGSQWRYIGADNHHADATDFDFNGDNF